MSFVPYTVGVSSRQFFNRVFAWMSAGLALSAASAYGIILWPEFYVRVLSNPGLVIGLFLAQISLVVVLSALIQKISFSTAVACFLGYAALLGVTLSSIVVLYTAESVYLSLGITAGMFGFMALYGYLTDADLSSLGSIARMGLFGVLIGLVANMFLQSSGFEYVLSLFGVAVFTVLTAYDVQKLKQVAGAAQAHGQDLNKIALLGALTLYLDFVNLFLMIIRLLGRRRD